jgi:hypothetical protein
MFLIKINGLIKYLEILIMIMMMQSKQQSKNKRFIQQNVESSPLLCDVFVF